MTGGLIYLTDGEMGALVRDSGPTHGGRVVQCAFGPGAVWLDPDLRDAAGNYPRWIVARLGVLRGLDISSMNLTDDERAELETFARTHGKEVIA